MKSCILAAINPSCRLAMRNSMSEQARLPLGSFPLNLIFSVMVAVA